MVTRKRSGTPAAPEKQKGRKAAKEAAVVEEAEEDETETDAEDEGDAEAEAPKGRQRKGVKKEPKTKEEKAAPGNELKAALGAITKRMGNVVRSGKAPSNNTHIETGIFLLDYALLGGVPEGRTTMVYGHNDCMKTTTCGRIIGAAQRKHPDKEVTVVDAEGTLDVDWLVKNGASKERLHVIQPESGEEVVDVVDAVIRAQETSLLFLDSIPAVVPQAMIERSAEDKTMAVRAQLIGVMCSKILAGLSQARARGNAPVMLWTNQWRTKLGVIKGDARTLPGGSQPLFLSTVRIEMKNRGNSQVVKDKYGNDTEGAHDFAFQISKSKMGSSVKQGEFTLVTDSAYGLPAGTIDDYATVVTYGKRMGFIEGSGGAGFKLQDVDEKFRSGDAVAEYLENNPEQFTILKRKLIALKRMENGLPELPVDKYLLGYASTSRRRK